MGKKMTDLEGARRESVENNYWVQKYEEYLIFVNPFHNKFTVFLLK